MKTKMRITSMNILMWNKKHIRILYLMSLSLLGIMGQSYAKSPDFLLGDGDRLIAQQIITISGVVSDSKTGETMPGVNVVVKGTTVGVFTNADGSFSLTVKDENVTLIFSFLGYISQEIALEGRTKVDVTLVGDIYGLEEIVVVGYGTQKRVTLTGSIADVKGARLTESPSISVTNSLSGRLPGIIALNRSGQPGQDYAQILIRGSSTLGSNSPLIVIDGVAEREGFDQIDPRDIESVSVLKDASAAIYGARAANGVILITTKRGTLSKPTIRYDFNQGFTQPTRIPDYADAATIAEFQNEQLLEGGQSIKYTDEEIEKFRNGSDPINYPNTDWIGNTLKKISLQNRHSLSIQGGADAVKYFLSGNISNQDGMFKNGINNAKNVGVRSNIDLSINEYFKVFLDLSVNEQNTVDPASSIRPNDPNNYILEHMYRNYPYLVDVYPNGYYGPGYMDNANPLAMATGISGYQKYTKNLYQTKVGFRIDIPRITGLSIDGFLAYDKRNSQGKIFDKPYYVYMYDSEADAYERIITGGITAPQLKESYTANSRLSLNAKVQYEKTFGNHTTSSFIAIEQSENNMKYFSAFRKNFVSAEVDQLFAGGDSEQMTDGSESESARRNYFGRVSYSYLGKYLVDLNLRYDGSSAFPKDSRWGFFPGVSVGWRISEETFMKNSLSFINNLKLRGSWGQMGNDAIEPFQFLASYSFAQGYIFGNPNYVATGILPGVEPNPNITWEVANTSNIGLDAGFFNDLFSITLDIFKTKRSNILTQRNASVPNFTGLRLPLENIGVVENKGLEVSIMHRRKAGELFYSIGGNISYARNTVIDIDEAATQYEWQRATGHSMNTNLYYITLGIYRTEEEITNSPHPAGTRVNDLQYKDVNKDGIIDNADRVRLDKTNTPEIVFGMNSSVEYKQFDINLLFQGQARAWRYYFIPQGLGGNIIQEMADNRPSKDPNSKYPNLCSQESEVSAFISDFWLRDCSFVRLKSLELGYNLSQEFARKLRIEGLRIYASGFNLITIDKLKWFDPEGDTHRGAHYPQNKIYNIGINITL